MSRTRRGRGSPPLHDADDSTSPVEGGATEPTPAPAGRAKAAWRRWRATVGVITAVGAVALAGWRAHAGIATKADVDEVRAATAAAEKRLVDVSERVAVEEAKSNAADDRQTRLEKVVDRLEDLVHEVERLHAHP